MSVWELSAQEWQSALWTIAVAALANSACAVVGCYLVLRRLSLLGDAISHAMLPGIAVAFIVTGSTTSAVMLLGAMACGLLAAVLTQVLSGGVRVREDVSLGVVFTSMFSAGVILISAYARDIHLDPGCVLYGLVEFVSLYMVEVGGIEVPAACVPLALTWAVMLAVVVGAWKELKLTAFDPGLAGAMGISAELVHYVLMGLVALVTVTAFEAVGSILVVAMLIVPGVTGHMLSDRLLGMMLWAVVVAVVAAVVGYVGDLRWGTGMAGLMAVAAGAQFGLAALAAPRRGVISLAWNRFALALRIRTEDLLGGMFRAEEQAAAGGVAGAATCAGPAAAVRLPAAVRPEGLTWFDRLAWRRLARWGYVERQADTWVLTTRGRSEAQKLVRAHRLWEAFLEERLRLPTDHLHEPAERLEHYLGPELQAQLSEELGGARRDPHGREIPDRPQHG